MPDLSTTNMWLAILAVATVIQVLMLLGGAIVIARVVARANAAAETVERQVRPLTMEAQALVADLREVAARVKRVDDEMHAAAHRAGERLTKATETIGYAGRMVTNRTWPVLGIIRAAQAVVSNMKTRGSRKRDRDDEARFAYEGAPVDVR